MQFLQLFVCTCAHIHKVLLCVLVCTRVKKVCMCVSIHIEILCICASIHTYGSKDIKRVSE